ncbi:MAG: hypothetical protein ACK56I_31170 [bacterium]
MHYFYALGRYTKLKCGLRWRLGWTGARSILVPDRRQEQGASGSRWRRLRGWSKLLVQLI